MNRQNKKTTTMQGAIFNHNTQILFQEQNVVYNMMHRKNLQDNADMKLLCDILSLYF